MNEFELHQCLSSHPLTHGAFRGVYARDELANQRLVPHSLFVVNTDVRRNPGSHWVMCYWGQDPYPFYFDSFGELPGFKEIEDFLLQSSTKYTFNRQQLQGAASNVCGHYVAYVAVMLCSGYPIEEIRRHFSTKCFTLNDKLVTSLFRKEYGYPPIRYKCVRSPMICQCR
jgi:hypothetical protein